jgi:CheY-like chemotaxis protein
MGYTKKIHIDNDADDIEFFLAAVEYLSDGTSCFSFTNAVKALQKLTSGELIAGIIFLDPNMPIINWQEVLAALKAPTGLVDVPVIILFTSSDALAARKLKMEGASGFLTKPTSSKELSNLTGPYLIQSL